MLRLAAGRHWRIASHARIANVTRWMSVATPNKGKRVAVAMSGGVDSAAAAMLLKDAGFDVIGVFMKNWDSSDEQGMETCPLERDREDMVAVCDRLDIPVHSVEFVKDYWTDVFEPFLEAYRSGTLTPNPDVYCNKYIKFHKFREFAHRQLGADLIATGHYAQLVHSEDGEPPRLYCGEDEGKDQSYFLCMTPGRYFSTCLFPVGQYKKSEVKELVRERLAGLTVLAKKESMGVCFIGERALPGFLGNYIPITAGNFVDIDTGRVLGPHRGKEVYTIGQKAKIKDQQEKYYIARKVRDSPDIFVAAGAGHPSLFSDTVYADLSQFSWIAGRPPAFLSREASHSEQLSCKVRYRDPMMSCVCQISVGKDGKEMLKVSLADKTIKPNPGQILALYRGRECLGGGMIAEDDC